MLHSFCALICHQLPEKTFSDRGHFMYLCSRCTGIYSGLLLGFAYQAMAGRDRSEFPRPGIFLTGLGFILLTLVHIVLSPFLPGLDNNQLRFLTGLLCGGSISVFLFPVCNYFLREKSVNKPVIEGWRDYAVLLLILAAFFALHFVPYPPVFYLINYASVAGVIVTYITMNALLASLALDWKRRRKKFGSIALLCLTALVFLSIEIILFRHNPLRIR
jgi:uncharacterized membrane protein